MAIAPTPPRERSATDRALDDAIEAALAGRRTVPSGTTFVPAEADIPKVKRPYVMVEGGALELHRRYRWVHVIGASAVVLLFLAWWRGELPPDGR